MTEERSNGQEETRTPRGCYLRLPGYEHDVFISYTHLDNEPELEDEDEGWIDSFHYAFTKRLRKVLGAKQLDVWIDEKIHGNDEFDELLLRTLAKVGVLVSIISPSYLESEWCIRELETFAQNAGASPEAKRRIFPVIKEFVDFAARPEAIRKKTAYEFVRPSKSGEDYYPINPRTGAHKDQEFFDRLYELAADVARLLKDLHEQDEAAPAGQATAPAQPRATVFLAAAAPDMASARTDLLRNCRDRGYRVLPEDADEDGESGGLPGAHLSVHVLGSKYSAEVARTVTSLMAEVAANPQQGVEILEGSIEGLKTHVFRDRLEKLSLEKSGAYGGGHIIWIPTGLPEPEPEQAQLIAAVRGEVTPEAPEPASTPPAPAAPAAPTPQPVQSQSSAAVSPPPPAPDAGDHPSSVYLIYDQQDLDDPATQEALVALADQFDQAGVIVEHPAFGLPAEQHESEQAARKEQEELLKLHRQRLQECDGFLLLYGLGDSLWFQSILSELRKLPGLGRGEAARGVFLAPPESGAKKLFRARDLVVLKGIDDLSGFLAALPRGVAT